MTNYLRPGDGFIDVGANVGVYTLHAAVCVGRAGWIDSFEPSPKAVSRLRENLALNKFRNVRVHEVAAGATPCILRFTADMDTVNRIELEEFAGSAHTIEVLCVRLDDVLRGVPYAMGKMDIEGAEPLALQGAERMLKEGNPPVWLLEVNGALRRYGYTEEGLQDWLGERRYNLALYDADKGVLEVPAKPWTLSANVLAISRVHHKVVRADSRRSVCSIP